MCRSTVLFLYSHTYRILATIMVPFLNMLTRFLLLNRVYKSRSWMARKDPADLADLAHHHCGSFVVREMRRSDGPRR